MGKEQVRIVVRVQPNASRSEVVRFSDEVWHIKVAAPPVKGKANHELIKFLSEMLGIPKSSLAIERGITDRKKVIGIIGLMQNQVVERLEGRARLSNEASTENRAV